MKLVVWWFIWPIPHISSWMNKITWILSLYNITTQSWMPFKAGAWKRMKLNSWWYCPWRSLFATLNEDKKWRSTRDKGISPCRLFSKQSNPFNFVSWNIWSGISPEKLLRLRSSTWRNITLPISMGMLPCRPLFLRYIAGGKLKSLLYYWL